MGVRRPQGTGLMPLGTFVLSIPSLFVPRSEMLFLFSGDLRGDSRPGPR